MSRSATAVRPRDLLLRGATLSYLGVMVVLPMVAIGIEAARPGSGGLLVGALPTRSPCMR